MHVNQYQFSEIFYYRGHLINIVLYISLADLGDAPNRPLYGPKISQFHEFAWTFWQNRMMAPPGRLTPLHTGHSGSIFTI